MKKNKGFVILGLLAVCVVITATVFMLGRGPEGDNTLMNADTPAVDVSPVVSAEKPADVIVPDIQPGGSDTKLPDGDAQSDNPEIDGTTDEQTVIDVPLTVIEDKPEPPALPETAHNDEQEDEPQVKVTDPALTNPDKKPDVTPKPVETPKPQDTTPKSGDKNGVGEVYIPGFGWVKDEGGGGQGSESFVDESKLDNIIGH